MTLRPRWPRLRCERLEERVQLSTSADFLSLPLAFEPNLGQTDAQVQFLSRGPGYGLFLTPGAAVLNLYDSTNLADPGTILQAQFVGANLAAGVKGLEQQSGHSNYFIGNDSSKWQSDVPLFSKVHYESIYPGIDLVYYGTNQQQLEYDFIVAPGADPNIIKVAFEGAEGLTLDAAGNLVLHTTGGDVVQTAPVVYQEIGGARVAVAGSFVVRGNQVGFHLGDYDPALPLVIDPAVIYSTYLGGSAGDEVLDVTLGGNLYVTGYTRSADFPLNVARDSTRGGTSDAFVATYSATGSRGFCTYLGGSGRENEAGTLGGLAGIDYFNIALGPTVLYITGYTQSSDFPTTAGAFQTSLQGTQDAFVVELATSGNTLYYSSYLGGAGQEAGASIVRDTSGSSHGTVAVTGWTTSADFPVQTPLQGVLGGSVDAFVAKMNVVNSTLTFSTYLGGSGDDFGLDVDVNSTNDVYVTGRTLSSNFPTTAGLDQTLDGASDAFVARINTTGTVLQFSTYLGGSGDENLDPAHATNVGSLDVDSLGNVYLAGSTSSSDFPIFGPFDTTLGGSWDVYAAKLSSSGATLYATFLGGSGIDVATGVARDVTGNLFFTGYTESSDFPTLNATQPALAGTRDAFVTALDPAGITLAFSTFLGGSGGTEGTIARAIAVDNRFQAYVGGFTDATAFPTLLPAQAGYGGSGDGFLTRLAPLAGVEIGTQNTTITEGLSTVEVYTVVLNAPPTANVFLTVAPDGQVTVSPLVLTFTPVNWNTAQSVTITPVDDALIEAATHQGLITHTISSSDPLYNGLILPSRTPSIVDNDTVGVQFSTPTFNINEQGPTARNYSMRLMSPPTATVVITLNPDGQVSPSSSAVTFTTTNWSTYQQVTVTAVDDGIVETSPHLSVITHTVTSADTNYNGLSIGSATANITDNDTPGITIGQTGGTTVTENGPNDTYTMVLTSVPTADVFVTFNPGTQTTTSPSVLTFQAASWNTPQTVTITAVDDALTESTYPAAHTGTIAHSVTSADANYNGITIPGVTASIRDNDTAGIFLNRTTFTVNETGPTSATYTMVLTSTPTANVLVTLNSGTQVSVAPSVVTFTPANWFTIQTINVTAIDDGRVEGAHSGIISQAVTSADANYNGRALASITATITDNDTAGIFILETSASTTVSEAGPTSDTYSIRLLSQPSANVLLSINSGTQLSVALPVLTFTGASWNIPQTVTVSAADDMVDEAAAHTGLLLHLATSADTDYNGITLPSVTATVADNDTAGITMTESAGSSTIAEGGATDTYTVMLVTQPTADVLVTLNPDAQVAVSTTVLTFTSANWNVAQTVTLTATDDFMVEVSPHQGIVLQTVTSADPFYSGLAAPGITANITDNDVGGVAVTQTGGTSDVTEGGTSDTYTIALTSAPAANVFITVSPNAQVAVSATRLTFTSANWNVQQTVTITALDDAIFEGPHIGLITHTPSSADAVYNGIAIGSVTANVTDNDAVGILQSGGSTDVSEAGLNDTYTLVLASMPTANVVIAFNTGAQVSVAPNSLTFTPAVWNIPQTVAVSAVNDPVAENSHTGVILHTSSGGDPNYNAVVIPNVTANVTDNDSPGFVVTPTGGSTQITEGGTADFYDVVLVSQPTANVLVTLYPDATLNVLPGVLTFTPATWNVPQGVAVTALDDGVKGGVRNLFITHTESSTDPFYQGLSVPGVAVRLNDPPGVTITPTGGQNAILEGSAVSYTVILDIAPSAPVTLDLVGDAQLTLSVSQMVFTPTDWNIPRPVTVAATDDSLIEGPHEGNLGFTMSSLDPDYASLSQVNFAADVVDNDGEIVLGTSRADQIVVSTAADGTRILVSVNNQVTLLPTAIGQLVIQGGDGNDSIQVIGPLVPIVVLGGKGTDKLFVTGQTSPNLFTLDAGSVDLNGVDVEFAECESLVLTGKAGGDTFLVQDMPGFAVELKGDQGSDQVIAGNRANAWQITGTSAGTLNRTITLNGVESWTGGTSADRFVFGSGKNLGGQIDGGGGFDVLDYAAYTAAVSVNLQTLTATGTKSFANIGRVIGGKNGADRLIGPNQSVVWNISSANTGSVAGIAFQNFENLTGGTLDDTFHLADNQSVRGKIDGGGGLDHLDYSAFTSKAVAINLQAKTATSTGGFLNVEQFTGGAGSMLDTLTGANVNNTWTLTGRGTGSLTNGIGFTGFENLTGGSLSDAFALTTALGDWLGTLSGAGGKDTLVANPGQSNLWTSSTLSAGTLNGRKFQYIEVRR